MSKSKKYDTSQDAKRKQSLDEALQGLNAATLVLMVKSLWSGFVNLWEGSYDLRQEVPALHVPGEIVMDFLARLERAMVTNLPAAVVKTLEGRCGK